MVLVENIGMACGIKGFDHYERIVKELHINTGVPLS